MIQSLLCVHRLETGKLKPDLEFTNIAELIQEVMHSQLIKQKKIRYYYPLTDRKRFAWLPLTEIS